MKPMPLLCLSFAIAVAACGDPPEQQAGTTSFTPAASGEAINRIVITTVDDAVIADDEVVVAIRAEAIERLYGGTFIVTYDDSVMSLVDVEPGSLVAGGVLATTWGTGREVAGELAVGFALASEEIGALSGTLVELRLSVLGGRSSALGFRVPSYGGDSRERALIAADGVQIGGVRWFGGSAAREAF